MRRSDGTAVLMGVNHPNFKGVAGNGGMKFARKKVLKNPDVSESDLFDIDGFNPPPSRPEPPAPVADPSRSVSATDRVRLGADISREHHRRLRIHAINSGRTVLSVIEEWIEQFCPA